MNAALAQKKWWWGPKFLALVVLCFGVQFGLIVWLGQKQLPPSRSPDPAPHLLVAGPSSAEFLKLTDPTLFALPHKEGFSGAAWLSITSEVVQPFTWSEPPRYLDFSQQPPFKLAELSLRPVDLWPGQVEFVPDQYTAVLPETRYFVDASRLQLTGPLTKRRLLAVPVLPSWPFTDLLSNTVVQVLVTPEGRTFSWTLLERSGLKAADDHALELAREAAFEPLQDQPGSTGKWTWGELVFEWHTIPATNPASSKP